jgi:hypothetical protein
MFQGLEGCIKQLCAKALSTPESAELPRSLVKSIPSACRHLNVSGSAEGAHVAQRAVPVDSVECLVDAEDSYDEQN